MKYNLPSKKTKNLPLFSLFTLYAFGLILIFSMCSPLFRTNTWADANAFLTMGKGIVYGLVPYRDLFEQKGPLLYLMHAINTLLTPNQFWTIALFEAIALATSLIYIFKILSLYGTRLQATLVTLIYPYLLLPWSIFQTGNSAEEFVLPFVFITLYIVLKNLKLATDFTKKDFFILGICVAVVLWIKYTLLGVWIGFYFAILLSTVIKKNWNELKDAIIYTSLGLLLASLPILLYFAVNNAVSELFDIYFIFNMKSYPSQSSAPFLLALPVKLLQIIAVSLYYLQQNIVPGIFIIIGYISFMFSKENFVTKKEKLFFTSMISFSFLTAYFGLKAYAYYFLIVIPFTIFGLFSVSQWIKKILEKAPNVSKTLVKIPHIIFIIIAIVGTFYFTRQVNGNIGESKLFNKNTPIQEVYSNIMHEKSDFPTLLNYGVLDLGFYTAADILPSIRYFEHQNVEYSVYPDIMDGQNAAIANREIEFVVICHGFTSEVDFELLEANYTLIDYSQSYGAGPGAWFSLYEVKR